MKLKIVWSITVIQKQTSQACTAIYVDNNAITLTPCILLSCTDNAYVTQDLITYTYL